MKINKLSLQTDQHFSHYNYFLTIKNQKLASINFDELGF